jgi:hypothetical protein
VGTALAPAGLGYRDAFRDELGGVGGGLVARFPHALTPGHANRGRIVGRGTRRATRCAIVLLALGLGVNGIALCLCMAGPARAGSANGRDPHACCPKPGSHQESMPVTGTVIGASVSCCGSRATAPAFVARIGARDLLRHAATSVAGAYIPPDAPVAPFTLGASASFVRGASPTRTPVLRI